MTLSKKQLAQRAEAIGASESAALMGLSKYATPVEIFAEHRALIEGRETTKEVTLAMDLGSEIERPVANVYAKRNGVYVREAASLVDPRWPYSLATPDRAVFVDAPKFHHRRKLAREEIQCADYGLEVKVTNWRERDRWGPQGSDFLPDEHLVQVTKCMGITGLKRWDVAVLISGEFRTYTVHFNQAFFEQIVAVDERFMVDHVLKNVPPPVDGTEAYAKFLGEKWNTNKPNLIQPDESTQALVLQWAKVKEALRRLEGLEGRITNELKTIIGEFGGIEHGAIGKIYWRRSKDRTKVDHQALAADLLLLRRLEASTLPEGTARSEAIGAIEALVAKHTTMVPGNRPLVPYFSKPLKAQLAALGDLLTTLELEATCQTPEVEEQPGEPQ